jgi:hypothetical protein
MVFSVTLSHGLPHSFGFVVIVNVLVIFPFLHLLQSLHFPSQSTGFMAGSHGAVCSSFLHLAPPHSGALMISSVLVFLPFEHLPLAPPGYSQALHFPQSVLQSCLAPGLSQAQSLQGFGGVHDLDSVLPLHGLDRGQVLAFFFMSSVRVCLPFSPQH